MKQGEIVLQCINSGQLFPKTWGNTSIEFVTTEVPEDQKEDKEMSYQQHFLGARGGHKGQTSLLILCYYTNFLEFGLKVYFQKRP